MKNALQAIGFLTVLPIGKAEGFDPAKAIPGFPLAGLLIGAGLAGLDAAASRLWPSPVPAVLDVLFLVWITGALHLDGLGDTADGLYGNRPKERALEIMKDSRVGAMGLVAVFCGLSLKWAALGAMDAHRFLFLLIIPAYARSGMMIGIRFLPYGRAEDGTGHAFFGRPLKLLDFWAFLIPLVLSFLAGWRGLLLNIAFAALITALLTFYKRRMGCITGDMLGAMCEITEAALFLAVAVQAGS